MQASYSAEDGVGVWDVTKPSSSSRAQTLLDSRHRSVLSEGDSARHARLRNRSALWGPWAESWFSMNAPDGGPLAGLEAALGALAAGGGGWLAVIACDMPHAQADVLRRCLARADENDLDLVVLESEDGLEPLLGVVHTRALSAVTAALDRGERRMISFHGERPGWNAARGRTSGGSASTRSGPAT